MAFRYKELMRPVSPQAPPDGELDGTEPWLAKDYDTPGCTTQKCKDEEDEGKGDPGSGNSPCCTAEHEENPCLPPEKKKATNLAILQEQVREILAQGISARTAGG
ncbi:MAG TPA: hypothetical protein VHQ90_01735 [Thermoanaerobaculia bacterium]|nr:hypothetical protein [Thermoanaerobaculia bacterium]